MEGKAGSKYLYSIGDVISSLHRTRRCIFSFLVKCLPDVPEKQLDYFSVLAKLGYKLVNKEIIRYSAKQQPVG